MSERQRIARELHDNLDQGLAGIALQLSSSIKLFERDVKAGLKGMQRIQEMLIYCSEESRNAILELRGGWLEKMNVTDAIRQFSSMLEDQYQIAITVSVEGTTTRFKRYAERQIFRLPRRQ